MYCSNCRTEVEASNGYCSRCGTPLNARLCPNGHVMDPAWSECKYCPPAARTGGGGAKGRTLVEAAPAGGHSPGGFVKGATLLEDSPLPRPSARPGGAAGKGRTVVDNGSPGADTKKRTVYDPGLAAAASSAVAATAAPPRLVGWLVSFTKDPSGFDLRIREGRNVIGADKNDCDLVIEDASVSSRHAVVMCRDGKLQLRDNDSTNGTYLNDEDVFGRGAVPVVDRDRIRIGNVELTVHLI